jgi:hypothetical protein
MSIALGRARKILEDSMKYKNSDQITTEKLVTADIQQGDYRPVKCHKESFRSLLIGFPSKKPLSWNLSNYNKMKEVAKLYGLELENRWLRRTASDGTLEYAAYIGRSYIWVNLFFENSGKLLEDIGNVYEMSTKQNSD